MLCLLWPVCYNLFVITCCQDLFITFSWKLLQETCLPADIADGSILEHVSKCFGMPAKVTDNAEWKGETDKIMDNAMDNTMKNTMKNTMNRTVNSYTMNAGYMSRVFRSVLKTMDVKSFQNPDTLFLKKMAAAAVKSGGVSGAGENAGLSAKDLTMEEYQAYIYDQISLLPMHPTNMQDTISVKISDAGLKAMKEDSRYEQWVLDTVRASLAARDPWSGMCGGKYTVLSFGAGKEQYHGESWRAGYLNGSGSRLFQKKSEDSFWEHRAQRRKELAEQYEEILELRERNEDIAADEGMYYGDLAVMAAFKPKPVEI